MIRQARASDPDASGLAHRGPHGRLVEADVALGWHGRSRAGWAHRARTRHRLASARRLSGHYVDRGDHLCGSVPAGGRLPEAIIAPMRVLDRENYL